MPTMLDVAKRAGVALSTVSYALNGTRPISEPTRQRVLAAMEELDYHPNLLARSLITRRTRIIALLLPSTDLGPLTETQAEFVANAVRLTSERAYGLLLWTSPAEELNIRRLVQEGLIEGLVLMQVRLADERVAMLRNSGYPFALIGHCADNAGISYVDFDFAGAIRLAVDYLAGLGHHSIGLLNSAQALLDAGFGPAVRSSQAFTAVCAELGVRAIARTSAPAGQDGFDLVSRLLQEEPELTALIVMDEAILAAVPQSAYRLGLRIPDDLSVVSVLSRSTAEKMTPPMTNVEVPAGEMGRIGAELLIERLENGASPVRQMLLPPTLHVGQSCAPPRRRLAPEGALSAARRGEGR